jgi:hypothetical protein
MKSLRQKLILFLLLLMITAASMTLVTGCKEKKTATKPTSESQEEAKKSAPEAEDF